MNEDEKTCPRCAEMIKRAAVVCRYCGHEFGDTPAAVPQPSSTLRAEPKPATPAPTPPAQKQNRVAQVAAFGCLGLLALAFIGAVVGGGQAGNSFGNAEENLAALDMAATDLNALAENVVADAADKPASSSWSYDTSSDQVRGSTIYYANVESQNEVNFDFPYAGGSRLTMTVRKHPQYGQDVIFRISDGQFVCGIDGCSGTINYGRGPEHISLTTPADYDSKTLFASSASSVIAKLKSADRVIVELPFYQEGNRQFTFETKGLVWPPKN